jgi:glycolate oxidase iron-sulfur subunit
MRTNFSPERLEADPLLQEVNDILRKCVHCGFCTATCPTYTILGDELDSPRGRIYLLKDMLEGDKPASEGVVKHIDRCLTCLSCMTTCPSGVDYVHLVERGKVHIENTYARPWLDKATRNMLAWILPHTNRFRVAMLMGWLARPLAPLMPRSLRAMLEQARRPPHGVRQIERTGVHSPMTAGGASPKARVIMPVGCVQPALMPQINEATARLLTRHGVEVVVPKGQGCCGAVVSHMGKEGDAKDFARANIASWWMEKVSRGVDAIVVNASGCGSTFKDYAHLLRDDPDFAEKARILSEITFDITEYMTMLGLNEPVEKPGLVVAYHAACSLQHGQKVLDAPKALLRKAGYEVKEIANAHLCCGSAGTYSILQADLSEELRIRKVKTLEDTRPHVIAAGNIGCLTHISAGTEVPVVHTVELLDWATGGPKPAALR